MSMVALLIAPLLRNNADWTNWYRGFAPLGAFVIITAILIKKKILTWEDPLEGFASAEGKEDKGGVPLALPKPSSSRGSGTASGGSVYVEGRVIGVNAEQVAVAISP